MAKKRPTNSAADERYGAGTVAPSPAVAVVQTRRKAAAAAGTRTWLVLSESGASRVEEVGKHAIMRRTGLPGRDLRILDPMLSYPSTVLGRERAIVFKVEHVKAIITAVEVLVLNPRDQTVVGFVDELQRRVANFNPGANPFQQAEFADASASGTVNKGASASTLSTSISSNRPTPQSLIKNESEDGIEHARKMSKEALGPKILPFEFRVLEFCLEYACRCLETETEALDQEAYPALDELTSKISTLNLERVRQIKSRLVAISGRVQKVRDELEHLLDDDMDMAEMYLTDKLQEDEGLQETVAKGVNGENELESDEERYEDNRSRLRSISESAGDFKPNVEELEMLLGAYFVQIEGTLNKLSTLREYVDDTEDYINIMLDEKQNQLLQMGVMISTASLFLSVAIAAVGVFGMNITIDMFNPGVNPVKFWETTAIIVGVSLVLYLIAIVWGKKQGLLA